MVRALKIKYAILNVSKAGTYGAKSVVDVVIENNALLPRPYSLKIEFYHEERKVYEIIHNGIATPLKREIETTAEFEGASDKAIVTLTGILGIIKYDRKELHPA